MNLAAIANAACIAVNPNYIGTWSVSTGQTKAADYRQVPSFTPITGVPMQFQALSAGEIAHLDSLNIAGTLRGVWMNGQAQSLNRPAAKGGDQLIVATGLSGGATDTWLVVAVDEGWDAAGWSHVTVQLQNA